MSHWWERVSSVPLGFEALATRSPKDDQHLWKAAKRGVFGHIWSLCAIDKTRVYEDAQSIDHGCWIGVCVLFGTRRHFGTTLHMWTAPIASRYPAVGDTANQAYGQKVEPSHTCDAVKSEANRGKHPV